MNSTNADRPVEEDNPPSASSSSRPPQPFTSPPPTSRAQSYRAATLGRRSTRSAAPPQNQLDPEVSRSRTASTLSEDPEVLRPPRQPSPAPPGATAPPPAEEVTPLRFGAHYGGLVLASMIGTLIRLGLEALATYDGQVIFALAWAQGVGCGIMGLSLARKNDVVGFYPPLYTFLTTGIAGSVTTFSSWMLEGYEAFSNAASYNRKGLHDTVDGLAYSFSTFAISMACIQLGVQVSKGLPALSRLHPHRIMDEKRPSSEESASSPSPPPRHNPIRQHTTILDILTISTAAIAYLITLLLFFLAPRIWRHRATFPILLSPPGAMLRFALSRINTHHRFIDRFPLGTFIANMIATLVISGVYAAQRRPSAVGNAMTCDALYAIQQGFCGCLSTVSTFAVEAKAIRGVRWKWLYVGGSVVLGHVFVLAIVGGVRWGDGYLAVCTG